MEKNWIPVFAGSGRSINIASAKWVQPVDGNAVLVMWPGDSEPTRYRDEDAAMILRFLSPRTRNFEDFD